MSKPVRYRIKYEGGVYYAQVKTGWFWQTMPRYPRGDGFSYREDALEHIRKDKARRARDAAIPKYEPIP